MSALAAEWLPAMLDRERPPDHALLARLTRMVERSSPESFAAPNRVSDSEKWLFAERRGKSIMQSPTQSVCEMSMRNQTADLTDLCDIPGTTVFTAQMARKGFQPNQFCMSLMTAKNRERFRADESAYLQQWRLTAVAGYTQATTEIAQQTNLTIGLRYTYEDRKLIATEHFLAGGIPIVNLASVNTSKSFDRATYRVAVDHRLSDQTLAYVSFNTGFKSGGFNTQVPTDPAFAPETIKTYEFGLKNDLLDRRVRANVALFYTDYRNIQEQHLELTSSGVINGPPARIYGADLDLQARVTNALRLGVGFEYLHDRFVGANPPLPLGTPGGGVPLTTGSVEGNRLPVTPDTDVNVTADYTLALFGGEVDANATYEHNAGWFAEPDNIIHQPSFNKLNLSVRWTSQDARYNISLWGNNVTDVAVQGAGTTQVSGVQDVQYEAPRTYGITLGYHF